MIIILCEKVCMTTVFTQSNATGATIIKLLDPLVMFIDQNYVKTASIETKKCKAAYRGIFTNLGYKKVFKKIIEFNTCKKEFDAILENTHNNYLCVSSMLSYLKVNKVDITGKSKGHGFSGAMKRWNFSGSCASHGVSLTHRAVGSIGCRTGPKRVMKGKKMPGRYGQDSIYIKNVELLDINEDYVAVKGSIPGKNKSLCKIIIKQFY